MASLRVPCLGCVDGYVYDESILLPFVFFSGCDDEKCIPTFCDVRHVLRKLCVLPSLPKRIRYIPDVNSEAQPDPIRPAHQERHTVPLLPRRQHDCFRAKCPFTRDWIRIAVLFRTCISVNSCRTLTICVLCVGAGSCARLHARSFQATASRALSLHAALPAALPAAAAGSARPSRRKSARRTALGASPRRA